jgi:hypothetical protein
MKRAFFIPLSVLVLASMACALFGGPAEMPASLPTATQPSVVLAEEATVPAAEPTDDIQEIPTSAPAPTETEAPTKVPTAAPTDAPVDTPTAAGPLEFVDTFDHNQGDWSDDLIVTTQTSGRDLLSRTMIQDGILRFSFDDKETYMYKFFQTPINGNVTIATDYQALGHLNNGIAIVCKVNEAKTSWFEVRVSSTSDFSFYLYDKKRKTDLGKNPYLQIGKGKFKIDELFPTKPNAIQLTCLDNELILNANHDKRVVSQSLDVSLDGNSVGLGAMSYDVTPIKINFDQVTIREEQ